MNQLSASRVLALVAGFLLALQLMAIWVVVDGVDYFGIRLGAGILTGKPSPGQIPIVGAIFVAIGVGTAVGSALGNPRMFAGAGGLAASCLAVWVVVVNVGLQTHDGALGVAAVPSGAFTGPVLTMVAAFLLFLAAAIAGQTPPVAIDAPPADISGMAD